MIDKLSERELLLLLYQKVESLENAHSDMKELQLKVARIETKIAMYSAIVGVVSSIISSLIVYFLTK